MKAEVIALLQGEKDKKMADASSAVASEFDALIAAVQAMDESVSPDVKVLQDALAKDEADLASLRLILQADEDKLAKVKALVDELSQAAS